MKKSRIVPVYNADGSTNVAATRGKVGVYIIYDSNNNVEYVGHSASDLYKTLTRHFQTWNDGLNKQYRAKFNKFDYYVRVIICPKSKVLDLEAALILKYKPARNFQINLLFPKHRTARLMQEIADADIFIPF